MHAVANDLGYRRVVRGVRCRGRTCRPAQATGTLHARRGRMARHYILVLALAATLVSNTERAHAALTAAELRQQTPSDVITTIKTTEIADLEAALSGMKPEELSAFLSMLSKTLDLDDA